MQTNANTSVVSHDVETWSTWVSRANNAYIGFLTLTVIATVLIVAFNNRLNKAKDEAYAREKLASDEKVATAGQIAAQANERAGIANEAAARATAHASKADENAGKANERAGILEREAANLRVRAAEAEVEVARLTRLTKPRGLTKDQLAILHERLSAISDKIPIEIITVEYKYPTTLASELFAEQLLKLFTEAGWPKERISRLSIPSIPLTVPGGGIALRVITKGAVPPKYPVPVEELLLSLGAVGMPVVMWPEWGNREQNEDVRLTITVGLTPIVY